MNQKQITVNFTDRSDDHLKMYFKDISKIPLLTYIEEQQIYKDLLDDVKREKARDRLVTSNLRFCISIAKQYQNQGLSLLDLIEEANFGLIKASHLFNPEKGVKFLSYAIWWIRQSITDALTKVSRTIRVPNNRYNLLWRINRFISNYEQTYSNKPTTEEIAEWFEISPKTVSELLNISLKCVSVDGSLNNNDDGVLLDILADPFETADGLVISEDNYDIIHKVLKDIDVRDASVIRFLFGIDSEELNLDEVGRKFGISAERVRQIKERSLEKMKEIINEKYT